MAVRLPPFQALLDEHRDDVYRFLVASLGRDEADDCFQETFISALRAYPRLRDASNLRSWLFTIAHRKAIDAHRARGRRAVPVEEVPEQADAGGLGRTASPSSGGRSAGCPRNSGRRCFTDTSMTSPTWTSGR